MFNSYYEKNLAEARQRLIERELIHTDSHYAGELHNHLEKFHANGANKAED